MKPSGLEPISAESTMKADFFEGIPFDDVLGCIHCGLCLDACPTYRELGTEQDSPRGRLYLMRALWEGTLNPSTQVMEPLDRCVACRACETACPTRVPYGQLLEKTREAHVRTFAPRSWRIRAIRTLMKVFTGKGKAALWLSRLARLYQVTGLPQFFGSNWAERILPKKWVIAHRVMPRFEGRSFKKGYRQSRKRSAGPRVALFSGCIMDVADHEAHTASVTLLEAAGYQVEVPTEQGCCGALHAHRGFLPEAREMARANIAHFQKGEYTAIVVNAAGCGAQLKDYPGLLSHHPIPSSWDGPQWSKKIVDVMIFLANAPALGPHLFKNDPPVTVLYDAPCHLIHAQRGDSPVRQLLQRLPGVVLVPLMEAERCCGAGGIYNLIQTDLAEDMLKRKVDDLGRALRAHPEARLLLTSNPGCLYQLRAGVKSAYLPLSVQHPVVFLAERLKP